MRQTKYAVSLTEAGRAQSRTLGGRGTASARRLTRVLLKADQGDGGAAWTDAAIAGARELPPTTVARIRRQFVEDGLDAARARKRPDRVRPRALDGTAEAHLIAAACSAPPAGRDRWAPRLPADELVRLEIVEAASYETVRRTLKQTTPNRG